MSRLAQHREELNLTQEDLANKSGLSVRTIQRIESGVTPKGHTLKALAKALGIAESELSDNDSKKESLNYSLIKLINLSTLPVAFLPLVNIIVPLLAIWLTKQSNSLTKQMVSLQILWAILSVIIFLLTSFIKNWLSLGSKFSLAIMVFLVLANVFMVLRNAVEIDKRGKLYFVLNFDLI